MHERIERAAAVAGLLLIAACVGNGASSRIIGDDSREVARRVGSGIVINGTRSGGADRSILSVLRQRVAGLRVVPTGLCPEITMRGRTSIHGSPNPTVYVNDARSTNTCILDDIRMEDVDRVEVYPMGVGPNPSYRLSPNGLILVFTRHH